MPTVAELSDPYGNLMLNPELASAGTCGTCATFTPTQYPQCPACNQTPQITDAVLPISYAVEGEQLHHVLRGYKGVGGKAADRMQVELAAVLWRFLAIEGHEACLAKAANIDGFSLVTTVPSGSRERDGSHPLPRLVGELVKPTRDRFDRLLERTAEEVDSHLFSRDKYAPLRDLTGESVLLVDDTWVRGTSVQSAAAALKAAGAKTVGVLVIGRYIVPSFNDHKARINAIRTQFDWSTCWRHGA